MPLLNAQVTYNAVANGSPTGPVTWSNWTITPGVLNTDYQIISGGGSASTIEIKWLTANTYSLSVTGDNCGPAVQGVSPNIVVSPNGGRQAATAELGVIRWDLWHGNSNTTNSLNPNQYHNRIPFFGRETGINSVEILGSTPTITDQEIAYAKDAGITFFAFYWYIKFTSQNIDTLGNYWYGRERYKESTSLDKAQVKMCYILSNTSIDLNAWANPNSTELTQIGDDMLRADYHKININGVLRPLVFYHSSTGDSDDMITTNQRTNLVQAYRRNTPSAPDPYIVNLVVTGGATAALSTGPTRGQAMGQYVGTGDGGNSYAALAASDVESWNRYKDANNKVVPIVSVGFDRRPRVDNPVPWESPTNTSWIAQATPAELNLHLQAAIAFTEDNPTVCEAKTILMYAWNEHDEGGFVCPTIVPDGNFTPHAYAINREKLDVIKNLFV